MKTLKQKPWIVLGVILSLFVAYLGITFSSLSGKVVPSETPNKVLNTQGSKTAYFAGGCFWCIEGVMDAQDGVIEAISGYIGGEAIDANYDSVGTGKSKHREAVKVIYDPKKISYQELVKIYFRQIDPTDGEGQFADRGYQYTPAAYYSNETEKAFLEKYITELNTNKKFDKPIAVQVASLTPFYEAEEYHQDYAQKSSEKYKKYKKGSGRADYIESSPLKETKQTPEKKEARLKELTPLQYKVTQEGGTEKAFDNLYWDNKDVGIYVDIVDGSPLYSSLDKYDSGTGWPSFTKPINITNITKIEDNTLFTTRMEVRSKYADSHLGHVFNDGPSDKGGLRYCMNSASMKFIPISDLEKEGYSEYSKLFK